MVLAAVYTSQLKKKCSPNLVRCPLDLMIHRKRGTIINISAATSDFPVPLYSVAAASKVSSSIADRIIYAGYIAKCKGFHVK